jgi:hypothetical protein
MRMATTSKHPRNPDRKTMKNRKTVAQVVVLCTLVAALAGTAMLPANAEVRTAAPTRQTFQTGETSLGAVVDGNGTLIRGTAQSATRLGPGRYEVTFKTNVSKCAYTATIGHPGDQLVFNPALVFTAGGHASNKGVYVETKNLGGGLSDAPFHLNVNCSQKDRAVVDGNGTLIRGTAQSATRLGPGRYEVTFKTNVSKCAYTATIGHPGDQLVFNPALVFTAGGHASNKGVYIETKNLGGGLSDAPFHLNVNCSQKDRAVVDGNGTLIRGTAQSATRLGPGRYEVTFKTNVSKCAYTATIGHPGDQLVFHPHLVFTAGGHASNKGVYIETKNLGGGLSDAPFHLNLTCKN